MQIANGAFVAGRVMGRKGYVLWLLQLALKNGVRVA